MKAYHILLFESFVALRAAPILGHTNNNDHGDVLDRWIHRHRHDGSNSGATTKKLHSQGRALNNGNGNCRTFSTYTLDADIDANTVRDDTSATVEVPMYSPSTNKAVGILEFYLKMVSENSAVGMGTFVFGSEGVNALTYQTSLSIKPYVVTGGIGKYECAFGKADEIYPGPVANSTLFKFSVCNTC